MLHISLPIPAEVPRKGGDAKSRYKTFKRARAEARMRSPRVSSALTKRSVKDKSCMCCAADRHTNGASSFRDKGIASYVWSLAHLALALAHSVYFRAGLT